MRRSRCKIGERHTAMRRLEKYVNPRWCGRFNQSSSQSAPFVWLEPISLAENYIEIARRSGYAGASRKFEGDTAAGSPTVTAASQEGRDPGQRSQRWHCIPAHWLENGTKIGQLFGRYLLRNLGDREQEGEALRARHAAHADRYAAILKISTANNHPRSLS
jgi:hypothetical protein